MNLEPSSAAHETGFSLIELLSTVAVLAVVSAIAIPTFHSFSSSTEVAAVQADLQSCLMRVLARTPAGSVDVGSTRDAVAAAFGATCGFSDTDQSVLRLSFDGALFWLRAETSVGALALSNRGDRRWDRNRDGDFLDPGEVHWLQ